MNVRTIFQRQGGIKLLKQYWQGGALFTAMGEFLLLGKSRTALEILRLSAQLKTKQKLERKYRKTLWKFDKEYNENLPHESSNYVWICWFQGMEHAPELVKKCYQSVVKYNPDKKIIVITAKNMKHYVTFPDIIIDKWKQGIITHTHMTDLLRLELLIQYGGLWLDATVFCTGKTPEYFFDSDLFFFQTLKPGRDGHANYISSWLIEAKSNNKLLMAVRELCYTYWKKNNSMWDYFLFHDFFSIVLDYYQEEWEKVVPKDNATPHLLLLRLFEQYDENIWNAIKRQTPFHKLTYKFQKNKLDIQGTYYQVLLKGESI